MQRVSMFSLIAVVMRRDLQAALRRGSEWSNPLLFFVLVCTLFPLGVGPERAQLAALAPGVIWVVALLASMMATDSLFRSDYDDATLEQLLLSPVPLYPLVLAKTLTHWLLSGLPLSLLSPLLGTLLQLPSQAYGVLMLSLLLGSVVLSMIGAIAAALTVGLRRGGLLLSLIVLPLYIPVLIFGSAAVSNVVEGLPHQGPLAMLAALMMAALALAPLAIGGALRISVDQ